MHRVPTELAGRTVVNVRRTAMNAAPVERPRLFGVASVASLSSSLLSGVYLGFRVQQNCVQEFDARQPRTPGPLTNDGHAVYAVAYDQNALTVLTWGNTQQATWAWWDECVDEAYVILPPEAKKPGFAPGSTSRSCKATLPTWRADPQALAVFLAHNQGARPREPQPPPRVPSLTAQPRLTYTPVIC
jgi:hypothetical protein